MNIGWPADTAPPVRGNSLSTHGKQRFGMSAEQVKAQLRHTTTETQEHYNHDDLANLRDAVRGVDFEG